MSYISRVGLRKRREAAEVEDKLAAFCGLPVGMKLKALYAAARAVARMQESECAMARNDFNANAFDVQIMGEEVHVYLRLRDDPKKSNMSSMGCHKERGAVYIAGEVIMATRTNPYAQEPCGVYEWAISMLELWFGAHAFGAAYKQSTVLGILTRPGVYDKIMEYFGDLTTAHSMPPKLAALMGRCLKLNPAERPTMPVVVAELKVILTALEIGAPEAPNFVLRWKPVDDVCAAIVDTAMKSLPPAEAAAVAATVKRSNKAFGHYIREPMLGDDAMACGVMPHTPVGAAMGLPVDVDGYIIMYDANLAYAAECNPGDTVIQSIAEANECLARDLIRVWATPRQRGHDDLCFNEPQWAVLALLLERLMTEGRELELLERKTLEPLFERMKRLRDERLQLAAEKLRRQEQERKEQEDAEEQRREALKSLGMECCVCLEGDEHRLAACGHHMCVPCMDSWVAVNRTHRRVAKCPMCRTPMLSLPS